MAWLVRTVQGMTGVPVSVDSSNVETIATGLEECDQVEGQGRCSTPPRSSASRPSISPSSTAPASSSPRPAIPECRRAPGSASTMPRAWWSAAFERGIAGQRHLHRPAYLPDLGGRPLRDPQLRRHPRPAREVTAPAFHITGGMSNVSFGIPSRKWINDVFMVLAVEAGGRQRHHRSGDQPAGQGVRPRPRLASLPAGRGGADGPGRALRRVHPRLAPGGARETAAPGAAGPGRGRGNETASPAPGGRPPALRRGLRQPSCSPAASSCRTAPWPTSCTPTPSSTSTAATSRRAPR